MALWKSSIVLLLFAFIAPSFSEKPSAKKASQWRVQYFPIDAVDKMTKGVFRTRVGVSVKGTDSNEQNVPLVFVEEFYDQVNVRGRLDILDNRIRTTLMYDRDSNEYQYIHASSKTCVVASLDKLKEVNDKLAYWGWVDKSDNRIFIGPTALLRRGLKAAQCELVDDPGKDCNPPKRNNANEVSVRDIGTYSYSMQENDDILIIYYFAKPEWITPYQRKDVETTPIRIEVEHKTHTQVFDFVYFEPKARRFELEPIIGIGCNHDPDESKSRKKIPQIGNTFYLSMEMFNKAKAKEHMDAAEVDLTEVYFDYPLKVARINTNSAEETATSKICDFTLGIEYRIDLLGRCTVAPINEVFLQRMGWNSDMVTMKTGSEFLGLNEKYYYLGKARHREMYCDVYETVTENAIPIGLDTLYMKVVTTWYFTSREDVEETIDSETQNVVPVAMKITGYNKKEDQTEYETMVDTEINIFHYNNDLIEHSDTFNVEVCYPERDTKAHFSIFFKSNKDTAAAVLEQKKVFTADVLALILSQSQVISATRIPFIQTDVADDSIIVTALMLDKPNALSFFHREQSDFTALSLMKKITNVKDEEQCAQKCVTDKDGCKAFVYCSQTCFITGKKRDEPWGDQLPNYQMCGLYIRKSMVDWTTIPDLKTALGHISDAVSRNSFQVPIEVNGKETNVVAQRVDTNAKPFNWDERDEKYKIVHPGRALLESETTIDTKAASEVECYRLCANADTLACKSFSYCHLTKECRISSILVTKNDKTYLKESTNVDTRCDIFTRTYEQMFKEEEGTVVMVSGEKTVNGNLEACAMTCVEEKDFSCKSFEHCVGDVCILHKKHALDMTKSEVVKGASECKHFSYSYVSEYDDLGHTIVTDPDAPVIEGISLEECARTCSQNPDFKCASFNYCPTKTGKACMLTTQSFYTTENLDVNSTCQHFERKPDVVRRVTSTFKTGYSSGELTGIIFGTLIFGLILGAVLFVVYSYYRSKNNALGGTSVRFVKQEDSP